VDHHSREREEDRAARDAVIGAVVFNLVGLAVQVGIIVAIAKRDSIARLARRYQRYVAKEWRGAHERRLLAELSRDLSRIEHAGPGQW
jgi:hypothetical protein